MEPKKLPFAEFKKIYSRVPRLCVDLVIKDKRGIVFSKRDIPPAKGQWHLPGGTVFFGEKLEEAVKRVALDETSLKVKVQEIFGPIEYSSESAFGHSISIAFLVNPIGGKLRGSWQAKEIEFFTKIPENTIAEQKEFLQNYVLKSTRI